MFITIEKAIIDGKEIEKDKLDFAEIMEELSKKVETLKLNYEDDVIGRTLEEFEKEYPIENGADLLDYLFLNYRYHHHTKDKKAEFRLGNSILYLTFT